jgi:hypothetical protein
VTTGTGVGSTTSGGGSIDPSAPACDSVCKRYSVCPNNMDVAGCASSCRTSRNGNPGCVGFFDDLLKCYETAPISCPVDESTCKAMRDRYQNCASPPLPPPPIFDAGIAPQCASMPMMPGPRACSGGASGGGATATSSGSGGASAPQCSTICFDSNMNQWSSNCVGDSCSCRFNGQEFCRCATPSACQTGTCCPF